jgi:hypothetical protein
MLGTKVSEAKEICAPPFEHETVLIHSALDSHGFHVKQFASSVWPCAQIECPPTKPPTEFLGA